MAGGDDLRRGGHARCVGAQHPGSPHLRRSLVLRAGEIHVDALPQLDAQLPGRLAGHLPQGGGVEVGGVGEAHAELGQVLTPQGGLHEELDVVCNKHQIARLPVQVDAAGGVGDDQGIAAQQAEHPHRVGHLLIGVALVVVHTALHNSHLLPLQGAEHQLTLVAGGGGHLEMGDILIRHGNGVFHNIAHVAQAGTQDHGHLGGKAADLAADVVRALLVLGKRVVHKACPPYL